MSGVDGGLAGSRAERQPPVKRAVCGGGRLVVGR